MEDLNAFAQYGAWGALAYVIVKWVLPILKVNASRANVEDTIYNKSKDSVQYAYAQLERQREECELLREEVEALRKLLADEVRRRRELEKRLTDGS